MKSVAKKIRGLSYREEAMRKEADAQRSREHPNGVVNQQVQRNISHMNRVTLAIETAISRRERSARRLAKKPLVVQARREKKLRARVRNQVREGSIKQLFTYLEAHGVRVS